MRTTKLISGKTLLASAVVLASSIAAALYVSSLMAEQQAAASKNDLAGDELIYVPIYSSIYYEDGKETLELAATLSVHNVDPDRAVTISRIDYHDTQGRLIKQFLSKPLVLGALETKSFVVGRKDSSGGTGANFLVRWQPTPTATRPLVEALMVNASSNLGISFITSGRVVRLVRLDAP